MSRLARLAQLLDIRRTIRIERDLERLMQSSAALAQAAANLVSAQAKGRSADPYVMFLTLLEDITSNLDTIDQCLATGQVHQAKVLLDALILVTKRTGTDG